MLEFFKTLQEIKSIEGSLLQLQSLHEFTPKITLAIETATKFHEHQLRKSGIPYVIHPICVSSLVAFYGGDEAMICASLLHDVVEDTLCDIDYIYANFGEAVGDLVDALTKIVEIRNEEIPSAQNNEKMTAHALSFRKMLIASIKDARVLAIKICDRMHNMLTLDALSTKKQIRISEETLVVYAPIAHRLGISSLKNELEDRSFYYIYTDEYKKIESYLQEQRQDLELKLNSFTQTISKMLLKEGFLSDDFKIQSRVKRPYSIYLKMQRKGISIDEMLDLLAVRVIVKTPLDCYKVLGIVHLNLKPIPSRIKDYIALPKENGYQTIHTTVFEGASVYEIQIRTFDMHKSAEYGVAAHWKYKTGGINPSMDWLQNMQYSDNSIEEFYELATNELYREDIVVFSPKGDTVTLPVNSVALDYAYAIHSKLGDYAKEAYVNYQKASLLQKLKSGDIVNIVTDKETTARCTWIDSVRTSKAKSRMRILCNNKIKDIDKKSVVNMLATIFNREHSLFEDYIKEHGLEEKSTRAVADIAYLKDLRNQIKDAYKLDSGFFSKMKFTSIKLKPLVFDNLVLFTNRTINQTTFDYCCHPKYGDSIVAIKSGQKVIVHHKMCDKANEEINNKASQVFVKWATNTKVAYKILVAFEDKVGVLGDFLASLGRLQANVLKVNYDSYKKQFQTLAEVIFEADSQNIREIKLNITRRYKIVEFSSLKDAYQN
ncbi:penta-phosphate guanosine-3'-pyrophosphohydrolase [Helicobacter sp. 13S00401-1]|uniref:RelA/SpoT family protein n=1 Tax=Helicobacter sp. 13S00401-1 TaxID=1905758 RepID=UPI000BA563EF|nr:RelA/SpoT family protein [Helicobacter sp. 13S00401-1]PAF50777.1 penta-phosphate guanosine-3'-pyrophosphohydrolase [Helicobacter sp. 13S00401-1]